MSTILVTGCAGFIGFHTAKQLLARGDTVIGIDNLNDYYDPQLKQARLKILQQCSQFIFFKMDIVDNDLLVQTLKPFNIGKICHLAAQPGVRYSIENPQAYIQTNINGFFNILEFCRHRQIAHCVYASSSSVYGGNTELPFSTEHRVDKPLSLYAATKKSNELMAYSYSHLYHFPATGLRFFTVYGPWGRPDMAIYKFTQAILAGEPIDVYNQGHHLRDFTYIDDICRGILAVLDTPAQGARVFNIGNTHPVELGLCIELIEQALGKVAQKNYLPRQAGDMLDTFANVSDLSAAVGYQPKVSIESGIRQFVDWYCAYHQVEAVC